MCLVSWHSKFEFTFNEDIGANDTFLDELFNFILPPALTMKRGFKDNYLKTTTIL